MTSYRKRMRLRKENEFSINDTTSPLHKVTEERRIVGFWHIYMINDYVKIVTEQLRLLLKSGLYDKAEYIYANVYGSDEDAAKIEQIFSRNRKIRVWRIPENETHEFPSLKVLHDHVHLRKPFFGFYIHTKGVSYPNNEGGKHWRDYLNYYNITSWQRNIDKLMEGYDTCGVKLIPSGVFPMHYSGNFWWANSDYLKTLKPIEELNFEDRYSAEMWVCSNNPQAATLCQKFVDYDTKGEFIPEENRIVVHTLAYNLSTEVRDAVRIVHEQNNNTRFEHLIVDLGFPIVKGNEIPQDIEKAKLANSHENIITAQTYNCKFISIRNQGVSQNWEKARQHMRIGDTDVLICADPDERTKNNGWLQAISDVIQYGDKIAWCSLMMEEHLPYCKNFNKVLIHGHSVYILEGSLNWAQGGFNGKFLNKIGGVPVPEGAPIYGWIESACHHKMRELGYKVAILADYFVEHTECSPLYREWKTDITTNVKNGQIDFEEWLLKK